MNKPLHSRFDVSAGPDSPPASIPDHELLRRVGLGSYGEVWLARHTRLGTLRAVKIVRRDNFGDARPFQREFAGLQKYEPISRGHPNLMAILHVGGTDGAFYCVMELADDLHIERETQTVESTLKRPPSTLSHPKGKHRGQGGVTQPSNQTPRSYSPRTLRSEIKQNGALPIDRCLEIGHSLASALAHLHAHKLVHRDVKPSNVIFIDGMAKLADVGLVAGVDDTRSFVGTDGYIPPEGPGTPSADCYSLGKLLYELSTGSDRNSWPEPPSDLATRPDRERLLELNAIIHRACAPGPRERYANAEVMAADLALLQRGNSVKREHAWQRNLNHLKKLAAALVALAAVSAIVYSLMAWRPSQPESVWSNNEEANDAYRKGIGAFHQDAEDSFDVAAKHFERAIEIDPSFARAYARLANAYIWNDASDAKILLKARAFAEKSLSLDPKSDEAHSSVAGIKTLLLRDWSGAEKEALEAIRLNPNSDDNYYAYAGFLSIVGRTNEAVQQVEKALRVDSRSFASRQFAAFVLLGARRYDQAIGLISGVIDRQPTSRSRLTTDFLVPAFLNKGNYPMAIDLERQAALLRGQAPDQVTARYETLLKAYHEDGARGYWQRVLDWKKNDESDPVQLAILYARVGDKGMAFHYLDVALAESPPTRLTFVINREPGFDGLRGDPRFTGILRNLGFPQ